MTRINEFDPSNWRTGFSPPPIYTLIRFRFHFIWQSNFFIKDVILSSYFNSIEFSTTPARKLDAVRNGSESLKIAVFILPRPFKLDIRA